MPRYKRDVKLRVDADDIRIALGATNSIEHRVAVAVTYLSGARPIEIMALKKGDFIVLEDSVKMRVSTAKRGLDRTLEFDRKSTPFIEELIVPFVMSLADDETPLFSFSTPTRLRQIINTLSGGVFTPYTFRHNRHYQLAEQGATPYELMAWKGSKDINSVAPYVMRSGQMISKLKDKIK